jgi:hypothetical protein
MVEEVRGLAGGAHIGFADALLCQGGPETIEEPQASGAAIAVQPPAAEQTAAALRLNPDSAMASLLVLLHIRPAGPRPGALMLATAGQLGSWGMNAAGLALFGIDLPCRPPRPGLPLPPLRRAMLEKRTVADCVTIARRRYASSATAMVIAGRDDAIAGLEIRPAAVVSLAERAPGCIAVAQGAQNDQAVSARAGDPPTPAGLQRLAAELAAEHGRLDVAMLQRMVAEGGTGAGEHETGRDGAEQASLVAAPQDGLLHIYRNGCWRSYHV